MPEVIAGLENRSGAYFAGSDAGRPPVPERASEPVGSKVLRRPR
ncbi:MAG TPA: hypothetical protein PKJ45_06575 [Rubrivivax sp.]|nr:hypothetical protein [Rubrivivax sp.]